MECRAHPAAGIPLVGGAPHNTRSQRGQICLSWYAKHHRRHFIVIIIIAVPTITWSFIHSLHSTRNSQLIRLSKKSQINSIFFLYQVPPVGLAWHIKCKSGQRQVTKMLNRLCDSPKKLIVMGGRYKYLTLSHNNNHRSHPLPVSKTTNRFRIHFHRQNIHIFHLLKNYANFHSNCQRDKLNEHSNSMNQRIQHFDSIRDNRWRVWNPSRNLSFGAERNDE